MLGRRGEVIKGRLSDRHMSLGAPLIYARLKRQIVSRHMNWEQNRQTLKTIWTKYSQISTTCRAAKQGRFPRLRHHSAWILLLVRARQFQIEPLLTISQSQIQKVVRKTTLSLSKLWKWMFIIIKWTLNVHKTSQIQSFQISSNSL